METWECPACHTPVEAAGPALLQLAVANHIRAHERAAKRRGVAECGEKCAATMSTGMFCAARNYGDPNAPTPFDEQFLSGLQVTWDEPIPPNELKK